MQPIGRNLKVRHLKRFSAIVNVFARHGFFSLLERTEITSWLTPEQLGEARSLSSHSESSETSETNQNAIRLRLCFEQLGPAFVKLGQVMAARQDLLPKSYLDQLSLLHREVSAQPFQTVKQILDHELAEKMSQIAELEEKPLAAGSIGQVHRAKLVSGQRVVLKVQRNEIASIIRDDLEILEIVAGFVGRYLPEIEALDPKLILRQLKQALLGELDFIREAANTAKAGQNFADRPDFVIPKVYWDFTTQKVLCLEYLQGYSILDRDKHSETGLNVESLLGRGLEMFLQMVFIHREYHGDLHPGNLLLMRDGKLGVLDFGLSVHITEGFCRQLARLLLGIMNQDYEAIARVFAEISVPREEFDLDSFEADLGQTLGPFLGLNLKHLRGGKILWDLASVAHRNGLSVPRELILFFKTLAGFEGIGAQLDPDFDVFEHCQGFAEKLKEEVPGADVLKRDLALTVHDFSQLAKHAPFQLRQLLRTAVQGKLNLNISSEEARKLSSVLNVSSARLAVSIIVGAVVVGSSILAHARIGQEFHSISTFGLFGFGLAGLLGLYIVWSILRGTRF